MLEALLAALKAVAINAMESVGAALAHGLSAMAAGFLPKEREILVKVKAKYYAGDGGSSSIRLKFTMTPPNGQPIERKQSLSRYDLDHRALPPPGTKLLVLYVDETLQEVL